MRFPTRSATSARSLRRAENEHETRTQSGDSPPVGALCAGHEFVVRIPPAVHKKLALKATARGESLNQFVAEALAHA